MRFFTMEQDKMLQDMAKLRDFDICGPRHIFFRKDAAVIKPSTTLYFAADSGEALPDFIQSPIPLVDVYKRQPYRRRQPDHKLDAAEACGKNAGAME